MYKCTKCGTAVYQPKKTWKIKQTPVALLECPSCKTRWRSRLEGTITILPIVPLAVLNTIPEHEFEVQAPSLSRTAATSLTIAETKPAAGNNTEFVTKVSYPHLVNADGFGGARPVEGTDSQS